MQYFIRVMNQPPLKSIPHELNCFIRKLFLLKGTISNKKNLQITLDIKKSTFQSQYVPISKKMHNFDRKTAFHKISFRGH